MKLRRSRPWLSVVYLLGLGAADCGTDASWTTLRAADSVYAAVSSRAADYPQYRDGWGRHFRFEQNDSSFVLISAGPDAAFYTADDLDFSPTSLERRAVRVAGCWRTDSMAYPDGPIHSVRLLQTRVEGSADFRGEVSSPSADLRWVPWGEDSVVLFLLTGPQVTEVRALVTDSSLVGNRVVYGELFGWFRKQRRFMAQRITCTDG